MRDLLKKIILLGIIGVIIYMLLGYHFIIIRNNVRLLKKTSYNMDNIFYSTKGKRVETILDNDVLWKAGIGDLLVKEGLMSKEQLELYKETKRNK